MTLTTTLQHVLTNGGHTVVNTSFPYDTQSGFIVSAPGCEVKVPVDAEDAGAQLNNYYVNHCDRGHVGYWLDEGYIYCDVSHWYPNLKEALLWAIRNDQLAIYDPKNDRCIETGLRYQEEYDKVA